MGAMLDIGSHQSILMGRRFAPIGMRGARQKEGIKRQKQQSGYETAVPLSRKSQDDAGAPAHDVTGFQAGAAPALDAWWSDWS
jgi:hypothetical protein